MDLNQAQHPTGGGWPEVDFEVASWELPDIMRGAVPVESKVIVTEGESFTLPAEMALRPPTGAVHEEG